MDSAAALGNSFMARLGGRGTVLLAASLAFTVFLLAVLVAGIVLPVPETVVMAPFRW